jgi:predicted transcriptional regulator
MENERFNPFEMFTGIFIPDSIAKCNDLSHVTKLVYGQLLRYAGKDGSCFPKQETLASDFNVSVNTIKRAIKQLVDFDLIEVEKSSALKHNPNRYYFLYNDRFFNRDTSTKNDTSGSIKNDTSILYKNKIDKEYKENTKRKVESNNKFSNWRDDFDVYTEYVKFGFNEAVEDKSFYNNLEEIHKDVDVKETIRKIYKYWCSYAGYERKKKGRSKVINWKSTISNGFNQEWNIVEKKKDFTNSMLKDLERVYE